MEIITEHLNNTNFKVKVSLFTIFIQLFKVQKLCFKV
jgi:hypothetical protein